MEKAPSEFYKRGHGYEPKCKECLKKLRAGAYQKGKNQPKLTSKGRITNVIVRKAATMTPEQYKREMETVELILENLIYKVLSKKIAKVG